MFITSQIFGILALITAILSVQLKSKTKLLFLQILENMFKILALAFVGGLSGAYAETVGLIRKMWFFNTSRHHKINKIGSLIFFTVLASVVGFVIWEGWITLLPVIAVIIGTYGLWQENIYVLRYIALVASILYGAYAIIVGAYTNAVSEVFMIVSVIVSIVRFKYQENHPEKHKAHKERLKIKVK